MFWGESQTKRNKKKAKVSLRDGNGELRVLPNNDRRAFYPTLKEKQKTIFVFFYY